MESVAEEVMGVEVFQRRVGKSLVMVGVEEVLGTVNWTRNFCGLVEAGMMR